ncbi:MAG: translation initiation factor IF-3 [Candidatus Parcubacteria bacterium]|nr:translation initiation factor IF-3 [Candidatus Parcubacteria bacterium]
MKYYRLNNRIRSLQVRLIDETGKFLNVINIEEALRLAREKGLDLVEINPKTDPPIAKIMDFGQFRYEENKKEKGQKVKKNETKCIRISLRTGKHDVEIKINQAKKFFSEGHKVRFEMLLRGRERTHQDLAEKTMNDLVTALGEGAKIEQPLSRQGAKVSVTVAFK